MASRECTGKRKGNACFSLATFHCKRCCALHSLFHMLLFLCAQLTYRLDSLHSVHFEQCALCRSSALTFSLAWRTEIPTILNCAATRLQLKPSSRGRFYVSITAIYIVNYIEFLCRFAQLHCGLPIVSHATFIYYVCMCACCKSLRALATLRIRSVLLLQLWQVQPKRKVIAVCSLAFVTFAAPPASQL